MGYLGTQIRDGALYVDITPEVLGLPSLTPLCGIPIEYQGAWKKFGEAFKAVATTTCPVDTGFLRDNIDFHADDGGVECWSDATYSAYQEYGTYKMAPQPYFEGALAAAFSETGDLFNTAILMYSEMDNDFSCLLARKYHSQLYRTYQSVGQVYQDSYNNHQYLLCNQPEEKRNHYPSQNT